MLHCNQWKICKHEKQEKQWNQKNGKEKKKKEWFMFKSEKEKRWEAMNEKEEKPTTQKERVLQFLKDNGQMTNWDAIRLFGLTCLQVTIQALRKDYVIETQMVDSKNRFGESTRHGVYIYKGELKR